MNPRLARACVVLGAVALAEIAHAGCGQEPNATTRHTTAPATLKDAAAPGGTNVYMPADSGRTMLDAAVPPVPKTSDAATAPDASTSPASLRIAPGNAVFFVGNGFFGDSDHRLPDLVRHMGDAVTPAFPMETSSHIVFGTHPLSWFLQQSDSQNAIASGDYDVFILQAEEREPVDSPEAFKQAVRDYDTQVRAHGGRIMLFMTWELPREQGSSFFAQLSAAYDAIGAELGVPVIPAGSIYDDCNKQPYGTETSYWLTNQEGFPNDEGMLVSTYATFAMLTGINPMGLPVPGYSPPGVTPDLYRYLSDKSWARVEPRLGK